MPEWSLLQWLDAGDVPLILIAIGLLWRLERRVLLIEFHLGVKKPKVPKL